MGCRAAAVTPPPTPSRYRASRTQPSSEVPPHRPAGRRARTVLAYGIERRELSHNVAASMKKVPRVRREMATYTPDEIRLVLRAADKVRNGHLWYLALSGLR